MRWFFYNKRWHAYDGDAPADQITDERAVCGFGFYPAQVDIIEATAEDPFPPEPCTACLIKVGMLDVDDEPLDVALSRGYLPYAPDDESTPSAGTPSHSTAPAGPTD